jgi:hypothetical protein
MEIGMKNVFHIQYNLTRASYFVLGALLSIFTPDVSRAQLIDPNNHCVYRPGSTICEPIRPPVAPPPSGNPCSQFLEVVENSGIDKTRHPTNSCDYFNERARAYCGLLAQGELMKVVKELQFPPVINWTETTTDRPRLEMAILRIGTQNFCADFWSQEQQIEGSVMR